MLVARLHEWGDTPVIEEQPSPNPAALPAGELLVRVDAAAVTHLDLTVMSGQFAHQPTLPFVPGTAAVGTVLHGDGVDEGTRVTIRGGGVGLVRDGTWAGQVSVPAGATRPVAAAVESAVAATCYAPVTTAWAGVDVVGQVRPGQRVLVTGASGAVGSLCVQLAARAGAHVVAVVGRQEKATSVPDAAAEVVVGRTAETARRLAGDGEADVLLDTVGGDTVPTFLPALRHGARAVLIGYTAGTALTVDLPNLFARGVRLLPVNMIRQKVPRDVADGLLADLAAGRLALRVSAYPFDRLTAAIHSLRAGTAAGTVAVLL